MKQSTKGRGLPRASSIDQHEIFGTKPGAGDVGPATRRSHPITSHRAAKKAAGKLTAKQLAVLDVMQRYRRPMTHDEIIIGWRGGRSTGQSWYPMMTDSSVRTRVKELSTLGYVDVYDRDGVSAGGGRSTRWTLSTAGVLVDVARLRPVE